jgi:nicotinate-nucleotide pyrophosphorylase
MKPNNAHEHVLVVGQYRHRFDIIDMSMLAKNHVKTQL